MPKIKKQRQHAINAIRSRWSVERNLEESSDATSDEDFNASTILNDEIDFSSELNLSDIRDLFSFCKERLNYRYLSV